MQIPFHRISGDVTAGSFKSSPKVFPQTPFGMAKMILF